VGSGKSLKGHIEFGKHNICACVLWTDGKPKEFFFLKITQNGYY
jgi:hypothetical protein